MSCLDRAFDDQSQQRIRLETEAISLIFNRIDAGEWTHVSSQMVRLEITRMPDLDRAIAFAMAIESIARTCACAITLALI